MSEHKLKLLELAKRWRRTAQSTRNASADFENLLARGHMHGVSDGLELAADDLDTILAEDAPPEE